MESFRPDANFENAQINPSTVSTLTETYTPENMRLLRDMEAGVASTTSNTSSDSASSSQIDFLSDFVLFESGSDSQKMASSSPSVEPDRALVPFEITEGPLNASATPDNGKGAKKEEIKTEEQIKEEQKSADTKNDSIEAIPNPKEIQKHIENLGNRDFRIRAEAQKSLEKIGPPAMPALQKAYEDTEIPEVMQRAGFVIEKIQKQEDLINLKDFLKIPSKETADRVSSLLSKAGVSFMYDDKNMTRPGFTGEKKRYDVIFGHPNGETLSAGEKKQVEELIKMGDRLKDDDKFWRAKSMAEKMDGRDAASNDLKMNTLALISTDGRLLYARALSNSKEPDDIKRGVELLTDVLKNHKNPQKEVASSMFIKGAANLDAGKDPKFLEAFKNAGGDVEYLESLSKRYRAFKARN